MPIKAGELDKALQYLRSGVPRQGMFSVLDELIRNAPFERADPAQWQQYLQPGQTLTRAGVNFPLKKEELDYSGLNEVLSDFQRSPRTKGSLLDYLHSTRPQFGRQLNQLNADLPEITEESRSRLGHPNYMEHAHPVDDATDYTEDITTSPSFGVFNSHFTPGDLSWSRTTKHEAATPAVETETGRAQRNLVRLIEEIQSDRHEAAAEKVYSPSEDLRNRIQQLTGRTIPTQLEGEDVFHVARRLPDAGEGADLRDQLADSLGRRGYRSPEEQAIDNARRINHSTDSDRYHLLSNEEQTRLDNIRRKPPDTPFKNPEDYAGLEMRKQLLNAVNEGDRYLALTRGADQIERYGQGMEGGKGEGMSYIYDTIYPSVLGKLAKQYGAHMAEVPVEVGSGGVDTRAPTLVHHGVENPTDLLDMADTNDEAVQRAHALLADFETIRGGNPDYDAALDRARQSLTQAEGGREAFRNWEPLYDDFNTLHSLWSDHGEGEGIGTPKEKVQKTFPAMEITPDVAERVRRAGVPLWSLAGATAAGLGSRYSDANANPVEDAAEGHAAGGSVGNHMSNVDPLMLVQAAKSRHYAYKPLGSEHMLGQDYTPSALQGRSITESPAAAAALTAQGVKGANKPAIAGRPQSPLNPVEPKANGNALPGFAEGGSVLSKIAKVLSRLLGNAPEEAAAAPTSDRVLDLARKMQNNQTMTMAEYNELIGHLANAPQPLGFGKSVGEPVSAQERLKRTTSQTDPNSGVDPYNTAQSFFDRQENDQLLPQAIAGHADGGSIKWLADKARELGIPSYAEDRARVATGIAKQFYGLDEQGNPVLGGHAWLSSQHGTPPRILDELTSIPGSTIELINAINGPGPKDVSQMHAPQWSKDAQARLDALDKKVREVTGVGQAQTLPEHIEDAAGMLATPLPAAKVAKETPMLQRALEYLAPVRPPTAARYATDSAALGGVSAGLDKLIERLSQKPARDPGALDPEFEQAAVEHTNAMDQ